MTRQDNILSFMQEFMGHRTRRNNERTNYGEDLSLLREDVNRILETGETPGLTDVVEDSRDRVENLEEFLTSKNSDPTGFMYVGDPYTRPARSIRVKISQSQKVKHKARVKQRHSSDTGHKDPEDSDYIGSSSYSSSPDSDRSNKDTTSRNGDSTSSNSGSSSDYHHRKSRSWKSSKSERSTRSSRTRMDKTIHVVPDIHNRRKGPKNRELKEVQPTNLPFRSLLSYGTYRLGDLSDQRIPLGTSKIKSHITGLELTMRRHTFDGEDSIHVLDFLARFIREAYTLKMSKAHAYTVVPYFVRGHAEQQFNAVRGSSSAREGGVTCLPGAEQYLLRSYETSSAIRGAILDLIYTRLHHDDTEIGFSFQTAFYSCGNVHISEEKATIFVDGVDPVIKTLIEQRREEPGRMSYLEFLQCARAEGEPKNTPMLEQETHSWKPMKARRWARNDKFMFAESTRVSSRRINPITLKTEYTSLVKRIVRYPRTNCPPPE